MNVLIKLSYFYYREINRNAFLAKNFHIELCIIKLLSDLLDNILFYKSKKHRASYRQFTQEPASWYNEK